MTNFVPIQVVFGTDMKRVNTVFSVDDPIEVKFMATYKKHNKNPMYLGRGYIGDRISNTTL